MSRIDPISTLAPEGASSAAARRSAALKDFLRRLPESPTICAIGSAVTRASARCKHFRMAQQTDAACCARRPNPACPRVGAIMLSSVVLILLIADPVKADRLERAARLIEAARREIPPASGRDE